MTLDTIYLTRHAVRLVSFSGQLSFQDVRHAHVAGLGAELVTISAFFIDDQ